jgi:hypothetical protein
VIIVRCYKICLLPKHSEKGKNYYSLDSRVIIVVRILNFMILILCQDLSSTYGIRQILRGL